MPILFLATVLRLIFPIRSLQFFFANGMRGEYIASNETEPVIIRMKFRSAFEIRE